LSSKNAKKHKNAHNTPKNTTTSPNGY